MDSVVESAYQSTVNPFWKHLTADKQAEAQELYMTRSFFRHAYADKRELAYNQFNHDLVINDEFESANKLFDLVNNFVFEHGE